MNSLTGRAYVENFIRLLPFVIPAYQSISLSLSTLSEQDLEFLVNHIKQQLTNEEDATDKQHTGFTYP